MKKKLFIAIPLVLVVTYISVVGFLTIRAKVKYDSFASESSQPKIVELTPEIEEKLSDRLSTMEVQEMIDPAMQKEKQMIHGDLELPYDTQGFVDLLTFEPPAFHLFDMDENRLNSQKLILQQIVSANFGDEIFVKRENNIITRALIRISHSDSYVEIKNDEDGVYSESVYYTSPDGDGVEQGSSDNGIRRVTL